jgi:hypothetical protein
VVLVGLTELVDVAALVEVTGLAPRLARLKRVGCGSPAAGAVRGFWRGVVIPEG